MLTGIIIFIHVIVCILLATLILIQSGKGGGLTEQFAPAGEMFGTQANSMLVKGTTIFAGIFLVTCLGLAVISAKKDESLMSRKVAVPTAAQATIPTEEDVAKELEKASAQAEEAASEAAQQVEAATKAVGEAKPLQPADAK